MKDINCYFEKGWGNEMERKKRFFKNLYMKKMVKNG